ncbi:hypothetical protein SAMD00019534_067960 [Acytostelium subglobosum LB1]|uniref:hypothetical protein n=1 Tax=Acytostelium subglobosum LB1 TaxID=1410327 RepID=UPI000644C7C6|nr:hypothetical protein SAMD00019534_067960 [Acytostelium subglobosum LB1]GAM23621.1 hypothetical protein SAMD00019534_067960 [Acytostelium subglobosum LB1]|eukprot:XP_012753362.1 hypothetical protein SAMD00019534_067960 [Acytostelium subglobosum LB1]
MLDRSFLAPLVTSLVDQPDKQHNLLLQYLKLLRLNFERPNLYEIIKEVFGAERVESELNQWFLSPLSRGYVSNHLEQKFNYLFTLPNKSASSLLINHKQDVLKFICTSFNHCDLTIMKLSHNLSLVLTIILIDDGDISDANIQALIDMLNKEKDRRDRFDQVFIEVQSFIKPIDTFLQFFDKLNANNKSIIITHFGASFLPVSRSLVHSLN